MSLAEGATRKGFARIAGLLLALLLAVSACERGREPEGTGGEEPEPGAAPLEGGAVEEDAKAPPGARTDEPLEPDDAGDLPESEPADATADPPLELPAPPPFEAEDLREGEGPAASRGDLVTVRYRASLATGEVFSESAEEPYRFRLGSGVAILGLERGVEGLRPGGRRRLTVPAHLAWGQRGVKDAGSGEYAVPPGATVIFDVELVAIEEPAGGPGDGSAEKDPSPAPADPRPETGETPETDP